MTSIRLSVGEGSGHHPERRGGQIWLLRSYHCLRWSKHGKEHPQAANHRVTQLDASTCFPHHPACSNVHANFCTRTPYFSEIRRRTMSCHSMAAVPRTIRKQTWKVDFARTSDACFQAPTSSQESGTVPLIQAFPRTWRLKMLKLASNLGQTTPVTCGSLRNFTPPSAKTFDGPNFHAHRALVPDARPLFKHVVRAKKHPNTLAKTWPMLLH